MINSIQESIECGLCGVIGDNNPLKNYDEDDSDNEYEQPVVLHRSVRTETTVDSRYETSDDDEIKYIARLLARRTMHLPHFGYWQDYLQFFNNNHPVFGICLCHPLHPLQRGHRIWMLIASFSFGLAATNIVYLYYVVHDDEVDKVFVDIELNDMTFGDVHALTLTYGMLTLWTFGGLLHTIFDLMMWYLSACACFLTGVSCSKRSKLKLIGMYTVIAITAVLIVLAVFVVTLRGSYEQRLRGMERGQPMEEFSWTDLTKVENYSFLIGYFIELLLVYFCYYPIIIFALFNGFIPCLGRNREIQKQRREREDRMHSKLIKKYSQSSNHNSTIFVNEEPIKREEQQQNEGDCSREQQQRNDGECVSTTTTTTTTQHNRFGFPHIHIPLPTNLPLTLPTIEVTMEEDLNDEEWYVNERKHELAMELEEEKQRAMKEREQLEKTLKPFDFVKERSLPNFDIDEVSSFGSIQTYAIFDGTKCLV